MSYESPIEVIYDNFIQEVTRKFDDTIVTACQKFDITVDKNELSKALAYDRDQYIKGFKDGEKNAHEAIPIDWIESKINHLKDQIIDLDPDDLDATEDLLAKVAVLVELVCEWKLREEE